MRAPDPVIVVDLFEPERAALLDLLASLTPGEWASDTVCSGWSVKDIAAHIIADDLGVVSRRRDGYMAGFIDTDSWDVLLAAINRANEEWVASMRRLSPGLICELLEFAGRRFADAMRARDPHEIGDPVDWAGPEPAPAWLDIAREYTERWLHQQQIRDAVDRPGLKDRRMFAPVLDTFARALPHTYRDVTAPEGTRVRLTVEGEAGGAWSIVRDSGRWRMDAGLGHPPDAGVTLDQETAWRLFTKGITPDAARERARIAGDIALGSVALTMVSIIA